MPRHGYNGYHHDLAVAIISGIFCLIVGIILMAVFKRKLLVPFNGGYDGTGFRLMDHFLKWVTKFTLGGIVLVACFSWESDAMVITQTAQYLASLNCGHHRIMTTAYHYDYCIPRRDPIRVRVRV